MRYDRIRRAVFLRRPNRFIAVVSLDGAETVCHVKNTGRCRELLVPGATVLVQHCPAPGRRTAWDLISVYKGETLINMDAAAPNRVFAQWAEAGGFLPGLTLLRPECRHGDSRFDFYVEAGARRGFVEVKGVTLEENGVVRFPDAPTLRGAKHLRGLADCVREGFEAWAVFIVQLSGARYLEPARANDPDFARAMEEARDAGVRLLALECAVTERSIDPAGPVEIRL